MVVCVYVYVCVCGWVCICKDYRFLCVVLEQNRPTFVMVLIAQKSLTSSIYVIWFLKNSSLVTKLPINDLEGDVYPRIHFLFEKIILLPKPRKTALKSVYLSSSMSNLQLLKCNEITKKVKKSKKNNICYYYENTYLDT